MHHRSLLLLSLVTLSAPATAQSAKILGRDNAQYARALLRAGYADLAEGVCKAIADAAKEGKDSSDISRTELIEAEGLGLDLRMLRALKDPDIIKRKDEISAVILEKEKFIQEHPRSEEAIEARNNMPDAYRSLGEALTTAVQKEKDPAVVAKLRDEGEKAFVNAENGLKARLETLKADRVDKPEIDQQYMAASFNLARTYYFHARFYPAGEYSKTLLLQKAVASFEEFGLDYPDQLLNYEAMVYVGLCHKDLEQPDQALEYFNDAISLRDNPDWPADSKGLHVVPPEAADTISGGVLQKVNLLTEKKRYQEAAETAQDFYNTVADAEHSALGLAIMAAWVDALDEGGNGKGAGELAQRLVELDPNGPWGARGRDKLAKMITGAGKGSGGLGAGEMLKVAQNMNAQGKIDQAIEICRKALDVARGDPAQADDGASALLLMGTIYSQQKDYPEAAVSFDMAVELFPKAKPAPDALSRAIDTYIRLNGQEKRPFFKKRVEDRSALMLRDYPDNPEAQRLQLKAGADLESQNKFLEAAELYERVPTSSQSYEEAEARAGTCYYRHASTLLDAKKNAEAAPFFAKAETLLKKAMTDLTAAEQKTLDSDVLARIASTKFTALATLGQLYLKEGVNRPADVLTLLNGLDEKYGNDPKKVETIWTLRIKALASLGKLDDAIGQLDALLLKNPNSNSLAAAAGVLARVLDQEGINLREKDAKSKRADELWRKAASYYQVSVRGKESPKEAELVADRLLVFGMHFNDVPEDLTSFVGWEPQAPPDPELWEQASKLYDTVLVTSPSYRLLISLARAQGFLGHWKEAANAYAKLFEQETLVKKDRSGFDQNVLRAKPELLYAYLAWGVTEYEAGKAEHQPDRLSRASDIFDVMLKEIRTPDTKLWWQLKYYQIACLMERGMYEPADIVMNDIVRTTGDNYDEGKFGFKTKLEKLRSNLETKVIRKQDGKQN